MTDIHNIDIELLQIHPKNVRKTYNDIEELAESIKAQGILQNLTIVPNPDELGKYLTVIGNRRLTAARMAGLKSVPCIISTMDEKEQASVMLLENMQRKDLTIYEQAQGFQMMLDLGETEESIADKTGFSKTTIRRRLNIAKLDQTKLQEREADESFQLSLTDLYTLEKVQDIEQRNKILGEARDSRDLARMAETAVREAKRKKNKEIIIKILEGKGVEKAPENVSQEIYSNKWQKIVTVELDGETPADIEVPNGEKEKLYWYENWREVSVLKKVKKEVKEKTKEEIKRDEENKKKKQLNAIGKEMKAKIRDFILDVISGKVDALKAGEEPIQGLWDAILMGNAYAYENSVLAFKSGKDWYSLSQEDKDDAIVWRNTLSMVHTMMIIATKSVETVEPTNYDGTYNKLFHERMERLYKCLALYGFHVDDEQEVAVYEGTHELYKKEDAEPEEEGEE